jgi:hypothetical protein
MNEWGIETTEFNLRVKKQEEIEGLKEERDMLAFENKAMASYITKQYDSNNIGKDVEAIIFEYEEEE